MTKPINLHEKRAERNGELTPKALVESLLTAIERGEVENIIYVVKRQDGEILTGWSQENHLPLLGMLECGKQGVLEDMYE